MKKIFLGVFCVIAVCFSLFFTSCKRESRITLTPAILSAIQSAEIKSKKGQNQSSEYYMQYYVSKDLVFKWNSSESSSSDIVINKDGTIRQVDTKVKKEIKIDKKTLGKLVDISGYNGSRILKIDFGNVTLQFQEDSTGKFQLADEYIVVTSTGETYYAQNTCYLQIKYSHKKVKINKTYKAKDSKI